MKWSSPERRGRGRVAALRRAVCLALVCAASGGSAAGADEPHQDDPLLHAVFLDQLEWRGGAAWQAQAWIGYDLHKLRIESEGEPGAIGGHRQEYRVYYGHAASPYWDVVAGWRGDAGPARRDWLALGVRGLAPYFVEVEAEIVAGAAGRVGARIELEQEWLLTQRIALVPEMEVHAFGSTDETFGVGAGVSELQAALRLQVAIRRDAAPYAGVVWKTAFGETARLYRAAGHARRELAIVFGLNAWF